MNAARDIERVTCKPCRRDQHGDCRGSWLSNLEPMVCDCVECGDGPKPFDPTDEELDAMEKASRGGPF